MEEKLGKVVIAPAVLTALVRLTALSQPGVRRMAPFPPRLKRWLDKDRTCEGVRITVEDDSVAVDLYVVADASVNIRDLAETLQREITRAIHDMVGMSVHQVNVHIDSVEFTPLGQLPSHFGEESHHDHPRE
ncbi:MAG: Asp23/Gls24 family envelope stress response protein [Anaerolineae bacterium]|nr:Asp23/Gls24 family envelope stress response protein [Anaerolineae bacterium]